jgi:hypothetical protein
MLTTVQNPAVAGENLVVRKSRPTANCFYASTALAKRIQTILQSSVIVGSLT